MSSVIFTIMFTFCSLWIVLLRIELRQAKLDRKEAVEQLENYIKSEPLMARILENFNK